MRYGGLIVVERCEKSSRSPDLRQLERACAVLVSWLGTVLLFCLFVLARVPAAIARSVALFASI